MTNAAGSQHMDDNAKEPSKRQPRTPALWPEPEAYVDNRRPTDAAPKDALVRV